MLLAQSSKNETAVSLDLSTQEMNSEMIDNHYCESHTSSELFSSICPKRLICLCCDKLLIEIHRG